MDPRVCREKWRPFFSLSLKRVQRKIRFLDQARTLIEMKFSLNSRYPLIIKFLQNFFSTKETS